MFNRYYCMFGVMLQLRLNVHSCLKITLPSFSLFILYFLWCQAVNFRWLCWMQFAWAISLVSCCVWADPARSRSCPFCLFSRAVGEQKRGSLAISGRLFAMGWAPRRTETVFIFGKSVSDWDNAWVMRSNLERIVWHLGSWMRRSILLSSLRVLSIFSPNSPQ